MPSNARLLIVEDDDDMRLLLGRLLAADGYEIESVANSAAAIKALATQEPDLVLLDIVLGSEDGRDLLQELRRMSDVPVVFLTGRSHEIDRIAGLKMGADDYVVKPFSAGELSARVESVLRRSRRPGRPNGSVVFGELRIDLAAREIEVADRKVDLTPKEFSLLEYFLRNPRRVLTRTSIAEHVWDENFDPLTNLIDVHINRLRRKVDNGFSTRLIHTRRGAGYMLAAPNQLFSVVFGAENLGEPVAQIGFFLLEALMFSDDLVLAAFQRVIEFGYDADIATDKAARPQRLFGGRSQMHQQQFDAAIVGAALDLGEAVGGRRIDAGDELEVEHQIAAFRMPLQHRLDVLIEPVGRTEEQVALQVKALDLAAVLGQKRLVVA